MPVEIEKRKLTRGFRTPGRNCSLLSSVAASSCRLAVQIQSA